MQLSSRVAMHYPLMELSIEEVRTIMRVSGALEATLELVRELAELATAELAQVPLAPAASAALAELADQVAFRDE